MFDPKDIVVSKLDAARRQLRVAIDLWFTEGDPVAIHTLALASHEILHRLYRLKGLDDLVFDSTLIKPEYKKAYAHFLRDDSNFFKHAEKDGSDAAASITFNTASNDMYLVMSVAALQRIGEPLGDQEAALHYWLQCVKPHLFTEDPTQKPVPVEVAVQVRQMSRVEFFRDFMKGRWLRRNQSGAT